MDVSIKFSITAKRDTNVFLVYSGLHQIKSGLWFKSGEDI
jgi:hypothetical protein